MKKVTKAVIPAAGLGTRVLPATKAMPKGMLPIVDKPAIQYLVEEAVKSGITDILIILGRNQSIIEDHFDRSPELEEKLAKPGKEKALEECLGIANMANILFVRQKQTLGQVVLSNFANPAGLTSEGNNAWSETPASGQPVNGISGTGNLGTLFGNRLEASNVDLSQEMVNMIVYQRNYQSNSQTIKTQSELLQIVTNLG